MGVRIATVLVTLGALAFAPAALADTSASSNWAGYAVHGSHVSFRKVAATWVQPAANCTPGALSYSAYWVGLGGYSTNATALEQIGTEVDCTAKGSAISSAWYELVPAPSTPIRLVVNPGDRVRATVTVNGRTVTVTLADQTRHRAFQKTLHVSQVDVSSAEWIVEAPSDCLDAFNCQTLPLADFGSAQFTSARVQSTRGHTGSINDPSWRWTKIKLIPGGTRYVSTGGVAGAATPSALALRGTSFKVSFSQVSVANRAFFTARHTAVLLGRLFHPGR